MYSMSKEVEATKTETKTETETKISDIEVKVKTEAKEVKEAKEVELKAEAKEAVKEVAKETINILFSQLVIKYLNNADNFSKLSVTINPTMVQYLLKICQMNAELFTEINKTLMDIISDGKIDTKDIPKLIILVKNIYGIIKKTKNDTNVDPYGLIKTIINIIFNVYIETNNISNKELAEDLLKIIDVSLDLIKLESLKMPKIGCFSFLCFGKK